MTDLSPVAQFINQNPAVVLVVFLLSLAANLIQIWTYLRDRRALKRERGQREQLSKLVASYEDVLKLAKERVQNQDELERIKEEIQSGSVRAKGLQDRIRQLEQEARRSLLEQEINYNQDILIRAHEDIKQLRTQLEKVGGGDQGNAGLLEGVQGEVTLGLSRPYQLPRAFTFRATLLVLFLFLAPYPVDTLLLPFVLHLFLFTLFEALVYIPSLELRKRVVRFHSILIFLAYFAAWRAFYNVITGYLRGILLPTVLLGSIIPYFIVEYIPTLLALLSAVPGWKEAKDIFRSEFAARLIDEDQTKSGRSNNMQITSCL